MRRVNAHAATCEYDPNIPRTVTGRAWSRQEGNQAEQIWKYQEDLEAFDWAGGEVDSEEGDLAAELLEDE